MDGKSNNRESTTSVNLNLETSITNKQTNIKRQNINGGHKEYSEFVIGNESFFECQGIIEGLRQSFFIEPIQRKFLPIIITSRYYYLIFSLPVGSDIPLVEPNENSCVALMNPECLAQFDILEEFLSHLCSSYQKIWIIFEMSEILDIRRFVYKIVVLLLHF